MGRGEGCAHSKVPHVPGSHGGSSPFVNLAGGAAGLCGGSGMAGCAWLLGGIGKGTPVPCRAKMDGVVCWKAILE